MFNGYNAHILRYPYLHRSAILEGIRSEQVSHMLEAVLETQLDKLEKPPISEEDQKILISKTK